MTTVNGERIPVEFNYFKNTILLIYHSKYEGDAN